MKHKIVFFGTPDHAKNVLQKFHEDENIEVVGVITNPDRPVGRKKILTASPVKRFAVENNIPVLTPENFKKGENEKLGEGDDADKWLQEKNADFSVVVAYGVLVPQSIIDIPKKGTFNLHFSLLPKYRGASPIQSAILNGDKISGISIFKLVLEMDAGDVFVQEKISIEGRKHLDVWNEMIEVGSQKFLDLCTNFSEFSGISQDEGGATFCGKFSKADGEVNISENSADEIYQKFLAFHLWPGIFFFDKNDNNKRVKLLDIEKISENLGLEISDFLSGVSGDTYKIGDFFMYNKTLFLQTVSGVLQINTLQKEGKKPVSGNEFFSF